MDLHQDKQIKSALRIVYTVLIFINNFAYGVSLNIIGATMVDLSYVYQISLEMISCINFTFSIGYMLGSLVSICCQRINRQLLLAFLVLMQAITIGLLPFYGHFWLAFIMMILCNAGAGGWDSATSLWLVELWPMENSAILQGNQFMYGAGTIVAPLMAAQFVYGIQNETIGAGNETVAISIDDRVSSLSVPYAVNGMMQALVPVIFFLMYFTYPYIQPTARERAVASGKPTNAAPIPFRKTKVLIVGLCLSTYLAAEMGFQIFCSPMFQYLPIRLSAAEAARVTSIMSTTFTFGRLLTAFISLKVPIDIILSYHFIIQAAAILLLYFSQNSLVAIYIGMAAMGYGFSALWPAVFGFTEQYLGLTDRICSFYVFLVGGTCLITPFIMSTGFQANPVILIYSTGGFVLVSGILFVTVRIWIAIDSPKNKPKSIENQPKMVNGMPLKEINGNIVAVK